MELLFSSAPDGKCLRIHLSKYFSTRANLPPPFVPMHDGRQPRTIFLFLAAVLECFELLQTGSLMGFQVLLLLKSKVRRISMSFIFPMVPQDRQDVQKTEPLQDNNNNQLTSLSSASDTTNLELMVNVPR